MQEIGNTDLKQKVHLGTVRDSYRGLKVAMSDRQNKIHGYRVTQIVLQKSQVKARSAKGGEALKLQQEIEDLN